MRGKITALAAGTLVAAFGIPSSASAAEPGFTVDPQSPAGVEYQVPLDSARGQGGGGSGHHGGGGALSGGNGGGTSGGGSNAASNSPTLFGSGITPAAGGKAAASTGGGQNGGRRSTGGQTSGSGGSGPAKSVAPSLAATASYSSTGPVAGIVGAILLVGGGLGIFLRLRSSRPRRIFS